MQVSSRRLGDGWPDDRRQRMYKQGRDIRVERFPSSPREKRILFVARFRGIDFNAPSSDLNGGDHSPTHHQQSSLSQQQQHSPTSDTDDDDDDGGHNSSRRFNQSTLGDIDMDSLAITDMSSTLNSSSSSSLSSSPFDRNSYRFNNNNNNNYFGGRDSGFSFTPPSGSSSFGSSSSSSLANLHTGQWNSSSSSFSTDFSSSSDSTSSSPSFDPWQETPTSLDQNSLFEWSNSDAMTCPYCKTCNSMIHKSDDLKCLKCGVSQPATPGISIKQIKDRILSIISNHKTYCSHNFSLYAFRKSAIVLSCDHCGRSYKALEDS